MKAVGEKRKRSEAMENEEKNTNRSIKKKIISFRKFPEEVVAEILSRVPVISLLRFRCVCKNWLRLLTIDPLTIQLLFNRLIKIKPYPNPSILFLPNPGSDSGLPNTQQYYVAEDCTSYDKPIALDVPFNIFPPNHYTVYVVCNGLICLTNDLDENHSNVYVWNPLIRDHIIIPCPPIPARFEHLECSIIFGLGFNHDTQEYKLIRLVYTLLFNSQFGEFFFKTHVCVQTLGSGLWRNLDSVLDPFGLNCISTDSVALVGGALHFLAARLGANFFNVIVSFDVKREVFREISAPNVVDYDNVNEVRLVELGGLLCMVYTLENEGVHIWTMQNYGVVCSWVNKFKIRLPNTNNCVPLSIATNGEIALQWNTTDLLVYDPRTMLIRMLKKSRFHSYQARAFVGTFVSPQRINGGRPHH